jgi:hypothetical protein
MSTSSAAAATTPTVLFHDTELGIMVVMPLAERLEEAEEHIRVQERLIATLEEKLKDADERSRRKDEHFASWVEVSQQ